MDVDDSLNLSSFPADVGDIGDSEDALPIDFNWTVDQEILLFEAMMGHKPVGVDKNIHMICIHRKMNSKWRLISKSAFITPKHIWTKLRSMYDLEALDESECVPFPEKTEDFALPNEDYGALMSGYPTNSNDTSRSSTVDREVDEETKNNDSAREEPTSEEMVSDSASTPSASIVTPSSTAVSATTATTATTTTTASATITATSSSSSVSPSTPTPASSSVTTISSVAPSVVTPSGPKATSTPTSSKANRKRPKANAAANQSESDKTPSGPSSAKRSRR